MERYEPAASKRALLELRGLCAGYGPARVLHDLDLSVHRGETLVVIGRNGVGKTTLIESIIGLTTHHAGEIWFDGKRIDGLPAHLRNRHGIAWVPQQREIFSSLTVEENLTVVHREGTWDTERVYSLFPRLEERRRNYGNQLSGGEQQMLALGRALMTNPSLLLLDEPVEGLAPLIVQEMLTAIDRMQLQSDMTIVLVEQKFDLALAHSERCAVIDHGSVVHSGLSSELLGNPRLMDRLLGVSA
ncbi:ABC transporter ATP-binding protein [Paraburkholderia elongata]|uniref:ATP-binding cassette domain-containing protein n=1 Tax=Paraburkholderia elongata TaxID=2675747 RepID=A0A972NL58_9BURK|nr:ABC transporter ATP-binding protein [Paraburkholderia elongata]NPT54922.1 ATP-binding cassette domain-containing protein [Paraburkholderia elongata]NPT60951.1 ATP-binding cassette domain-containing protein [Paraburkholderia elongata]